MQNLFLQSILLVASCLVGSTSAGSYMYGVLLANIPESSCTAADCTEIQTTMIASEVCAGDLMNITFGLPPPEIFEESDPPTPAPSQAPTPPPSELFVRRRLSEERRAAEAEAVLEAKMHQDRQLQGSFCSWCCSQPLICVPWPYDCTCNRRLEAEEEMKELEEENEEADEEVTEKVVVIGHDNGVQRRATSADEAQAELYWYQCWDDRQQALAWAVTKNCRRALRHANAEAFAHIE